jgi:DNA-binding XRE family transcriptional regulator
MRTVVKIPRILQINRISGQTISVIFNNGQSRIIDFKLLLPNLQVPESVIETLANPKEFKKVRVANHTLSWPNAGEIISFNGKRKKLPFEIGADILFKNSEPEQAVLLMGIGKKIRSIREKAGLSQNDLAQLSGTTRSYISRIENERSGIEVSTLQKIVETGLGKQLKIYIR